MGTSASLLAALALATAAPTNLLATSFAGWYTEIEDDLGNVDSRVTAVSTVGCVTTIVGEKGSWTVDWRTVRIIALEDVFVLIEVPAL